MSKLLYEEESYAIRGAVFEVYREMGSGFLESVYQECLEKELTRRAIPFSRQQPIALSYKEEQLEQTFAADLVCYGAIIVELKAVKELAAIHRAQVLNYLKCTGYRLGLLVNFGSYPRAEVERIVL
jgi:GxxExxY protein